MRISKVVDSAAHPCRCPGYARKKPRSQQSVIVDVDWAPQFFHRLRKASNCEASAGQHRAPGEMWREHPALIGQREVARFDVAEHSRIESKRRRVDYEIDRRGDRKRRSRPPLVDISGRCVDVAAPPYRVEIAGTLSVLQLEGIERVGGRRNVGVGLKVFNVEMALAGRRVRTLIDDVDRPIAQPRS